MRVPTWKPARQADRALVLVCFALVLALVPSAHGSPTVFVSPAERMVALGDTFTMSVRVDGGIDTLTCFLVQFEFDPVIIGLDTAGEGSLFTECGFPTMYNWDVLAPGEHSCNDVTLGPSTYALCPGELVRLSFTAAGIGETPIGITVVDLRDIRRHRILPVSVVDGYVIVGSTGDVAGDGDGDVENPRAFPNPFMDGTVITFSTPCASAAEVAVYDVRGRLVARRPVGIGPSGRGEAEWDGRDDSGWAVPSGIYFAALGSGEREARCRLVVLR